VSRRRVGAWVDKEVSGRSYASWGQEAQVTKLRQQHNWDLIRLNLADNAVVFQRKSRSCGWAGAGGTRHSLAPPS